MRILHLLSQIELTGAEVYTLTLCEWLIDQGHEVFIVSDKLHKPTRAHYISRKIHNARGWQRLRTILFLRDFLKQNKIQVIHCHSRAGARIAFWARLGLPVANIFTAHGRQHYSWSKKVFDIYGDRILGVCENALFILVKYFKMNPHKMICLRNPIMVSESKIRGTQTIREIAWIGRFSGPKGEILSHYLESHMENLLTNFPKLNFTLIGGELHQLSPKAQRSFQKIQYLLPGRLKHLSFIENLDREFHRFDMILGAGRVAIQSLLLEIPCFALGEYQSHGLINLENYPETIKSNFGDMGCDYLDRITPVEVIDSQLRDILQTPELADFTPQTAAQLRKLAIEDFGSASICQQILEIYQSTYFKRIHPHPIPTIMYHKIPDQDLEGPHKVYVNKTHFLKQMSWLKQWGFQTLTWGELQQFRKGEKHISQFPKRPIILTFDDGYEDNLTNAAPILKTFGFRAVLYLLAQTNIPSNIWDLGTPQTPLLSRTQRQQLLHSPFEIGSHGLDHSKITEKSEDDALFELTESKRLLEEELGQRILSYAFAYGVASPRDFHLARKAGYDFALMTDFGVCHFEDHNHRIFRVNIFPNENRLSFWKKTRWWYPYYFHKKKLRKNPLEPILEFK